MKQLYKKILTVLFLVLFSYGIQAQANRFQEIKNQADSSQRVWMREYLKVNDDAITRVFTIRDDMYSQVNRIRGDKSMAAVEQDKAVVTVRKQAELKIEEALGQVTYQLYLEAIIQRLRSSDRTSELPLTGTAN